MLDYRLYMGQGSEYIVLLHGIGGNSKIFYKQLKAYRKNYNVLAIHLPGHGNSPDIDTYNEKFSFDLIVREIGRTLDNLSIQKAHFVGISLGTIIVHHLLKKEPGRVSSAVLGGAVTRFNRLAKFLLKIASVIHGVVPFIWLYQFFAHILMPKKNHKYSRVFFVKEAKKISEKNFLAWFQIAQEVETSYENVQERSANIPKLYISGAEDHMFLKDLKQDLHGDDSSELVVLEECGHVSNIDKPEEFNTLSLEFFEKHQIKQVNIV